MGYGEAGRHAVEQHAVERYGIERRAVSRGPARLRPVEAPAHSPERPEPSSGGLTAMIVDDDRATRTLLRLAMESEDQPVEVRGEASSGLEALERFEDVDAAVIVLDQVMPGLSGVETARRILERRPGQPIVLCSAWIDEALRAEAEDAGITLCLLKTDLVLAPVALQRAVGVVATV